MTEAAAQTNLEGRDLTSLERSCAIQQLALRHGWHMPNGINCLLDQAFYESLYSKALPSPLRFTDEEWGKVLKDGHRDHNASGIVELESMVKDRLWSTLGFPLRIIDGGDYRGPRMDRTSGELRLQYPRNYDLRIPVSAQQPELSEVTIGDVLDQLWQQHFAGRIQRHELILKPLGTPNFTPTSGNPLQISPLRFIHYLEKNDRDATVEAWHEDEPLSTLLDDATGLGQVLQLCKVA